MDEIQQPEGYRATTRRQFTFYYKVTGTSWYFLGEMKGGVDLNPFAIFAKNASS